MTKTANNEVHESQPVRLMVIGSRAELFKAHIAAPVSFSDILKSKKQNGSCVDDVRV